MNLLHGASLTYSYLLHRWKSTSVQVLHSPFVYRLYTECILQDKPIAISKVLEPLRKEALRDSRLLTYPDPGSGSHATHSHTQRQVKQLARYSLKPPAQARLLHRLVNYVAPKTVLELGTSLGITTCYMASALPNNGKVFTIEAAEPVIPLAQSHISTAGLSDSVEVIHGLFDDVLPALLPQLQRVDMVYADGNHRYEPTVNYVKQLLPYLHNDSVVILDDIYWSRGMQQAWQEIIQWPEVRVSIDLFHFGLLFFRKEQVKEHFILSV
jgi:predicted O-methyltransferase YrrM